MELEIPDLCLVVLVGASGAGKSTFAARCFGQFEVVSSDHCRALISDDEHDQSATGHAFRLLHQLVDSRLAMRRLVVVDATNVKRAARRKLLELAAERDVAAVAIVFDVADDVLAQRCHMVDGVGVPLPAVQRQARQLKGALPGLVEEGFSAVHVLQDVHQINQVTVARTRMSCDRRDLPGPFDVIGDVHGCFVELGALLEKLGYGVVRDELGQPINAVHPQGRQVVFVGDLVNRGPDSVGVLRLAMGMVAAGQATCVLGNHERKLIKYLTGEAQSVDRAVMSTLAQLADCGRDFSAQVLRWCQQLPAHVVLDDGGLVVAHVGLRERFQGRDSQRVVKAAVYGEASGDRDEWGHPILKNWMSSYRGDALVVFGYLPVAEPQWVSNTLDIDSGCVFGGRLTALRYPERELVSVPAVKAWWSLVKPLGDPPGLREAPQS